MILVNGRETDQLPVADRGLQYGDGLFETLMVRDARPLHWERHLARLTADCTRLAIPAPDPDRLRREAAQVCQDAAAGTLKILVTRGAGERGYRPPPPSAGVQATRILALYPAPAYPEAHRREGVVTRICATRLGINPALAGIKHLNRLEQVLARAEWDDPAIPEGLMLDLHGRVVEGTMSNLFLVRDGTLITPDLARCGVAGVVRAIILEQAAARGIPCQVRDVAAEELTGAEEIFLCNSLIGIWPVCRIDRHTYTSRSLTLRLAEWLTLV
ncbi:MAG: aminodeoxychorismate lyase [Chromatiales bacterium 21-64-14]|nr:MAG: aminodeoxychorismate lyase [Chromatiales bacterium 21-64-14]HQU16317.1 aminodeoxychorismate lyase [Gammaproteobacteria bacterium]